LEKKIHEYEKKLNDLRGGASVSSSNFNNSSSMGKLNTLSAAILEKVLKQA
jgi:hypothetical protein